MGPTGLKKAIKINSPWGESEWADRHFKTMVVNMLKDIKENIHIVIEDMGNLSRETETIKKKWREIIELKKIQRLKNSLDSLSSIVGPAK